MIMLSVHDKNTRRQKLLLNHGHVDDYHDKSIEIMFESQRVLVITEMFENYDLLSVPQFKCYKHKPPGLQHPLDF